MANDGGLVAKLEQWFADQLAALKYNGVAVFKTADIWRHQIAATKGGLEASDGLSAYAFVSYQSVDGQREGGYDLRQVMGFAILIGVSSREAGVARFGDANNLGTSKIRDLVIALFDKQHPDGDLACDEIYYTDELEVIDSPNRHAIQMNFEVSYLTI
jgi:hypothetical protein